MQRVIVQKPILIKMVAQRRADEPVGFGVSTPVPVYWSWYWDQYLVQYVERDL